MTDGNTSTTEVKNIDPKILDSVEKPEDWKLDAKGVSKTGETDILFGPIWISSLARDTDHLNWGRVTEWFDKDSNHHKRAIGNGRFHEQGNSLASELAGEGLHIKPGCEKKLLQYLAGFNPMARARSVDKLGWLVRADGDLVYVLPDKTLVPNVLPVKTKKSGGDSPVEAIVFQPERFAPVGALHSSCTLEEWNSEVAQKCYEHPMLMFALCVGLAPPLLQSSGIESGAIHIYGRSSHGKTTMLQVAASVMGCGADPASSPERTSIQRWNSTSNALEGLASSRNDGLLVLDELGSCVARDVGKVVYDLAGGQGKGAMDQSRNLKKNRSWRILIFSSGEISLRQKLEEDSTPKAGQLLRMLDIPIDDGAIAVSESSASTIKLLKASCSKYFGGAGPAFIQALIDNSTDGAIDLREQILKCHALLELPQGLGPELTRACDRFALIMTAGFLAADYSILRVTDKDNTAPQIEQIKGQVQAAVKTVCSMWLKGAVTIPDKDRAVEKIRDFIEKNKSARFENVKSNLDTKVVNQAGYIDVDNKLYLFTQAAFMEACGGLDVSGACKELKNRQLLDQNNGMDRWVSKHDVAGVRRSFYAVKFAILEVPDEPEWKEIETPPQAEPLGQLTIVPAVPLHK